MYLWGNMNQLSQQKPCWSPEELQPHLDPLALCHHGTAHPRDASAGGCGGQRQQPALHGQGRGGRWGFGNVWYRGSDFEVETKLSSGERREGIVVIHDW